MVAPAAMCISPGDSPACPDHRAIPKLSYRLSLSSAAIYYGKSWGDQDATVSPLGHRFSPYVCSWSGHDLCDPGRVFPGYIPFLTSGTYGLVLDHTFVLPFGDA